MSLRIGVVMDPIATIKPAKDTTLALLLEAQRRGWTLVYMELDDLYLEGGAAWARQRPLAVKDGSIRWRWRHSRTPCQHSTARPANRAAMVNASSQSGGAIRPHPPGGRGRAGLQWSGGPPPETPRGHASH